MKTIFVVFFLFFAQVTFIEHKAQADFKSNHKRYMSAIDIISVLNQKLFAYRSVPDFKVKAQCRSIFQANVSGLGVNSPGLNQPINKGPSPTFIRWLNDCLTQLLFYEVPEKVSVLRADWARDYLSLSIEKKYGLKGESELKKFVYERKWSELPEDDRRTILSTISERMIGPREIFLQHHLKSFGNFVSETSLVLEKLRPEDRIVTYVRSAITAIVQRDEFLRY
jgi:hypothetical protein